MKKMELIEKLYKLLETEFAPATIVEALSSAIALEIVRLKNTGDGLSIRKEEIALLDKTARELKEIVRKDR